MDDKKANKLEPVFGIKFTKGDKEILRAVAKKNRLTMCGYVRYVVFKDINKNKNEGKE